MLKPSRHFKYFESVAIKTGTFPNKFSQPWRDTKQKQTNAQLVAAEPAPTLQNTKTYHDPSSLK
jgi:hypothetical protein